MLSHRLAGFSRPSRVQLLELPGAINQPIYGVPYPGHLILLCVAIERVQDIWMQLIGIHDAVWDDHLDPSVKLIEYGIWVVGEQQPCADSFRWG